MMASATVDLPQPDSPTIARVLPCSTAKLMPFSARTDLARPKNPPELW